MTTPNERLYDARVALALRSIWAAGVVSGATTPEILRRITTYTVVAAEAGLPAPSTAEEVAPLEAAMRKALADVFAQFQPELDAARKGETV